MYKKWVVLFPWKAASKFYAHHSSSSRYVFKSLTPKLASWSAVLQLPLGHVTGLRGSPWLFQFQLKFLLKQANLGGHLSQIQRQWCGYSFFFFNISIPQFNLFTYWRGSCCFQLVATVNKPAVIIVWGFLCRHTFLFSLGRYQGAWFWILWWESFFL